MTGSDKKAPHSMFLSYNEF